MTRFSLVQRFNLALVASKNQFLVRGAVLTSLTQQIMITFDNLSCIEFNVETGKQNILGPDRIRTNLSFVVGGISSARATEEFASGATVISVVTKQVSLRGTSKIRNGCGSSTLPTNFGGGWGRGDFRG